MKKTSNRLHSLFAALAALVLAAALAVPAFAVEGGFADLYYRMFDDAEVLTEDEDNELEDALEELSLRQSFDVTIATIESMESVGADSMEQFADDLYDYCQYGYGPDMDGVLLLVSVGDRKWHISTCGYGITAFTDAGIQYLGEQMTPFMADGDYAGAFRTFVQWSDTYIDAAREGHPYDVNNLPREPLSLMYLFLALGIGLVLAWVVVSVMKSQLRSVAFQENAASYVREGSMNLTNSRELFLYRDVQRTERGPFGCDFQTYLGDQKHSCSNHCMFCFIDQLPPGMRESLYFKDDDERLSFLFGNYITMTNMQDHEIDRIIKMHISPINISVHTTNPQLRVRMLANKRGGEVLKYLPRLVEGGIAVNCQLVLCRGINDGDELRRTLSDLLELTPMVQSIAAVPCGVTDYREKLFKQTPYDAKTSAEVIDIMEEFGDECKRRHGKRIIYPSDEWYLKAGRPIPPEEFYEDFDQLENGVGMMRLYASEFLAELEKPHRIYGTKKMDVVTGEMASPLIRQMMAELHRQYPMVEVTVHTIKNKFFGGNVGVAGLVTATDIIAQCEGKLTSGTLGVPAVMLREEKDTFLDDITTDQLAQRLGVKVEVLPTSGGDEARALLRSGLHIARRRRA